MLKAAVIAPRTATPHASETLAPVAAMLGSGEHLKSFEWLAIGCIVAASAGSALGLRRRRRSAERPVCPAAPSDASVPSAPLMTGDKKMAPVSDG